MFFERLLRQLSSTVIMALAAFEDYDGIIATRCQVETAPDIGKRQRQILVAATCVGSRRRMLFPGGHQSRGQLFAAAQRDRRIKSHGESLVAASGSTNATYGT